jgi:hypothetical protein
VVRRDGQFRPQHVHIARRLNTQPHGLPFDLQHRQHDVVSNLDLLLRFPAKN